MLLQFARRSKRLQRRFSSSLSFSQFASSKDLESNNVFDNNVDSNNRFKNIFEYKIFNNKESKLSQLVNFGFRRFFRARRANSCVSTRNDRSLERLYIIARILNMSIKLYMLLALQQEYNGCLHCSAY